MSQKQAAESRQEADNGDTTIRTMRMVSLAGAVPLVLFAVLIVSAGGQSAIAAPVVDAFKIYSAVVLSFLGGVHWGVLFASMGPPSQSPTKDKPASPLAVIVPLVAPLVGWISVFLSGPLGFALLIVGFAGQGAWDNFAAHNGRLPIWFAKTRMILTGIVILAMAITMYAIA